MRPFTHTIPFDEACAIINGAVRPIDRQERIALGEASGHVCAADVVSPRDVPPFSRAAMDGYAVVAEDTTRASRQSPTMLRLVERVFTGHPPRVPVVSGMCSEIATGAPLPHGTDAVVMVEDTQIDGDIVRIFAAVAARQNVGAQGADIRAGQTAIRKGDVLTPSRLGAVAALGFTDVDVFVRPTVAVLSTGNELRNPGQSLAPGQIYDINTYTLSAIVRNHGCVPVPFATAEDTHEALDGAIDACLTCDVLVLSGGSSVGERDLILDAIRRRGEVVFHGIALKPGKPTAFALVDGKPVFAMPGNPTSCLSNAYVLMVPALRHIARLPPHRAGVVSLPLGRPIVSPAGKHQVCTVCIVGGEAMPAFKSSGDITSMSQADGYIEIGAETDIVAKGTTVLVTLF